MTPKQISIILHLYQPSIQSSAIFKQIYDSSYYPLLKLLKNNKNAHLTINAPLSLLEMMDIYGYSSWLESIAKLYETGKIELTGSAAYHPLLSQFSEKMQEDQIVLNEYGLGYYFGENKGFEGEKAILLKNVSGFFPPELAVNENVLRVVSGLGYSWVLVDSCAIPTAVDSIFQHGSGMALVKRNTELSNHIAFFRGFDPRHTLEKIEATTEDTLILAFDGETFGHHNKEGILYLDTLVDSLAQAQNKISTVSSLIKNVQATQALPMVDSIVASSWGASMEDIEQGVPLPFWKMPSHALHTALWEFYAYVDNAYQQLVAPKSDTTNLENVPLWKNEIAGNLADAELKKYIMTKLSYVRLVASDSAWWACEKKLLNGDVVYDKEFIKRHLELAVTVATFTQDLELQSIISKLHALL